MAGYQLSSHLLSLTASRRVMESNVFELCNRQPNNLSGVLKTRNEKFMGQGTKHRVTSWIVLGSPDNILKFVVMKKCTLAFQEFLKSSSKEGYYNPECPHEVSGNLTGKQSPRLYLNMAR